MRGASILLWCHLWTHGRSGAMQAHRERIPGPVSTPWGPLGGEVGATSDPLSPNPQRLR